MRSVKFKNYHCVCVPYGEHWYRLYLTKNNSDSLTALGQIIHKAGIDGIQNIIATEKEISIQTGDIDHVLAEIEKLDTSHNSYSGITYRLPIFFHDHPDWEIISSHTGLEKNKYIELLIAKTYDVSMLGFLVGFYYCRKLDQPLQIPRKSTPATRVASGSIAVASDYLGVYSLSSPGGWNTIGHTPIQLLDMKKYPPTLLQVGDKILLESIEHSLHEEILLQQLDINQYNARY